MLPSRYHYNIINNPSVRNDHLRFVIQLSDGVSVIGREDFPDKWTNLLPVCDFLNFVDLCGCSAQLHPCNNNNYCFTNRRNPNSTLRCRG